MERSTDRRLRMQAEVGRLGPTRIVLLLTAVALVLALGTSSVILAAIQHSRSSVERVVQDLERPMDHLLAAERANVAGQAALVTAVGSTGVARTTALSDAVQRSQDASSEVAKFRSARVGLPGEAELLRRFDAADRVAEQASSDALVPILNAEGTGSLPSSEVEAHRAVLDALIRLHDLYQQTQRAALADLREHTRNFQTMVRVGTGCALLILVVGGGISLRAARRIVGERIERAAENRLVGFEGQRRRALELVDDDASAFAVGDRGVREMLPGTRVSFLVADSSRAHLTPVSELPVCGVLSPAACPALRSGTTARFPDSDGLDACPVLAANRDQRCSATCVPVAITGQGAAVLHLVGPPGEPPDERGAAHLVARGVGERLTLLQALATFQLQAARDPLTGLLNRRSLEAAVAEVVASNQPYAVAFGDLDRFKQLNDTHGHEAGDRALRAFARTLRESVRPQDITCRWGGEEFVVVLPGCTTAPAVDAMERVRTNLALGSMSGQTTAVTVSFGVAEAGEGDAFDAVVERADTALRAAKEAGRNRVLAFGAVPELADEVAASER